MASTREIIENSIFHGILGFISAMFLNLYFIENDKLGIVFFFFLYCLCFGSLLWILDDLLKNTHEKNNKKRKKILAGENK